MITVDQINSHIQKWCDKEVVASIKDGRLILTKGEDNYVTFGKDILNMDVSDINIRDLNTGYAMLTKGFIPVPFEAMRTSKFDQNITSGMSKDEALKIAFS